MSEPTEYPDIFFTDDDHHMLASLKKEKGSPIGYDEYSGYVFWEDEIPTELTHNIRNVSNHRSLMNYRTRLWYYPQIGRETGELHPYETALWNWVHKHVPNWIGFTRQKLTMEEIKIIKEEIASCAAREDF